MHRIVFLIILLPLSIRAQDSLAGNIGGMIFKPSKEPFIVKADIIVPEGKETIIEAGCVFLFSPFAGIKVNGSLLVNGTPESLVVFTSCSDPKYVSDAKEPANPGDWNGIDIVPQADDILFSNFLLTYSTYGIKSNKIEMVLERAFFNDNGRNDFAINGKMQPITFGVPFNYGKRKDEKTEITAKQEKSGVSSIVSSNVKPLIIGSAGIVTGVAAIVTFVKMDEVEKDYRNEFDPARQKELEKKHTTTRAAGIICTGASAICLPISAMLFIKNRHKVQKSVSIYFLSPTDSEMEIGMTIRF
jgi:hypothetical protein